jgi:CRISPR-associated helicase Cas3
MLAERWHTWRSGIVAVTAGTGAGKTLSALLPPLMRGESVLAAYPTNALLRDQAVAIQRIATGCGKRATVLDSDSDATDGGVADVEVVPIDGPGLESARQRRGFRWKGEALDLLLTVSSKPKVVVTNPDVLYLLAAMRYRESASAVARLSAYSTLVVDEFHLYTGVELARLLYLIQLLSRFAASVPGGLSRLVLLTATPSPEVMRLLRQVFGPIEVVAQDVQLELPPAGSRPVMDEVEFSVGTSHAPASSDAGDDIVDRVSGALLAEMQRLRASRASLSDERAVPAMVLLNSVVETRRLEARLLDTGWTEAEIGSVRGLMAQTNREWRGKTVVIATSAVEVGVDFDCRLLFFEATDLASFVQRLGRAGRHAPARAFLIGSSRSRASRALADELSRRGARVSRADLLDLAARVFPTSSAWADFAASWEGTFCGVSVTERILDSVARDFGAPQNARERVCESLLQIERGYFDGWQQRRSAAGENGDDVVRLHGKVRRDVDRGARGKSAAHPWIRTYLDAFPSFRAAGAEVEVLDREEEARGRAPTYSADLRTLVRWARLGPDCAPAVGAKGYLYEVVGYASEPARYLLVLVKPKGWSDVWPPPDLFCIARQAADDSATVEGCVVSEAAGGRWPGPFPPSPEPILALVSSRDEVEALGLDWRTNTWPLRGSAGSADEASSKLVVLGDGCLLVRSLRRGRGSLMPCPQEVAGGPRIAP